MSSNDHYQNDGYANQAWSQSFSEVSVPRPPNTATESRVLSKIQKNDHQTSSTSTTSTTPKPNPAFSNPPPSINQNHQMKPSQQPLTLPEVRYQLSAEAKEFVPGSQVSYTSQESSQDAYGLSVTAAEFVPRVPDGYYSYTDQYYPNHPYRSYGQDLSNNLDVFNGLSIRDSYDLYPTYSAESNNTGNLILDRFNQALKVLNLNPGNMEEYLRPICEMIQASSDTTEIVNDVVESLFKQSIEESNFRYTGARICQFLNSKLKGNPCFSGFHKILIKRCTNEYNIRNELKNGSPADQERLRGLSLFMAEVFLNVEVEMENGSVQRLHFLPKILVDLVQTLLSTPSDPDVKCSCQLLKLSGSLIDDIVKNSSEECIKFEEIFVQLKSLQSNLELTENAKFLIGSVLKLKEAEWNRSTSSPPKKSLHSFSSEINNFKVSEPVFYNHMGTPCSRTEAGIPDEEDEDGAYVLNDEEEAAFLEWQAEQDAQTSDPSTWCSNDTGYGSYQLDDGTDDGGMGDEMEAAYEEFLQKQNFVHSYQPPKPLPNMPPQQEFSGHPQQLPHLRPPNLQQNRLPLHLQDQQLHHLQSNTQPHLWPNNPQQNRLPNHFQEQQLQQPHQMLPPNSQPLPPNQQQNNQLPPHLHDQQQYQQSFPKNDRYHYHR